jgi:serine/threonine protein kinase/WD40 repeat protein
VPPFQGLRFLRLTLNTQGVALGWNVAVPSERENSAMSEPSLDCNPFERIAAEFAERVRRGEHPSITEYIERYPELADDIRELFPMLAMVEQFKPEAHEIAAATTDPHCPASSDHPKQLGDYRILRYLGEGGMGVVYEAVRESLSNHVALKVMHSQYRGREKYLRLFRTEARSAARLHHTNIVSVFDYGVHDGTYYYAMQYIAGQSLDKILEDVRRLRAEKEQASPGSAPTMPWEPRDISALAGKAFGGAGPEADPVRQVVTVGFLTGAYEGDAQTLGPESSADAAPALSRSLTGGCQANAELADSPVGRIANPAYGDNAARRASPLSQLADFPLAQVGIGNTCYGDDAASPASPSSELAVRRAGRIGDPSYSGRKNRHAGRDDCREDHHAERDDYDGASSSTSTLAGKTDDRYHREVARLGAQIADGLAYAHKRGVFHRDIKPSNLILDPMGNIWITDFGLAKFEDGEDVSQSRDAAGTLRYMAPERFRGLSDGRCDVYALGATLYEMLTLRPAFGASNPLELVHQIEQESPARPRQIDGRISRDLETIVLKALAKNPSDRFASAGEMAKDLRLYLENRPIKSRPVPFYHQFWRWCQRNPWLAGANIAAAAMTTIVAIVSTVAAWSYQRAETRGRERLFDSLVSQAQASRFSHRMGQRFDGLSALSQAAAIGRGLGLPPGNFDLLRDEAIACMALPDLRPIGPPIRKPEVLASFAVDAGMTRYAFRLRDGTVLVCHAIDGQEIVRFPARGEREFQFFGFSPDGRYLAATHLPRAALTVWDIDRRAVLLDVQGPLRTWAVGFTPGNPGVAAFHENDGELRVYDLLTGRVRSRWPAPVPSGLAFRSDGDRIALTAHEQGKSTCRILEMATGQTVRTISLPGHSESVAWSPDGSTLATPCDDGRTCKICLWDATTGVRRATLEGHSSLGVRAAFHPSGALLASEGWEGRIWLWDPILSRAWLNLSGGGDLCFSRDGRIVVAFENKLTPYEVNPALEYRSFAYPSGPKLDYARLSIRHDGRILALGTDRGVAFWDLARSTELEFVPIGNAWHSAFEESGALLTSGDFGVQRWPVQFDPDGGQLQIGPPRSLRLPASRGAVAEDRTGRIVAVAAHGHAHVVTPDRAFHVDPRCDCRSVSVSPDGKWLATGSHLDGGLGSGGLPTVQKSPNCPSRVEPESVLARTENGC